MNLLLAPHQDMLCASAEKIAAALTGVPHEAQIRAAVRQAGLLDLLVPEQLEGAGLGTADLLLVLRAFARRMVPATFASTMIAQPLLTRTDAPDIQAHRARRLSGSCSLALAIDGDADGFDLGGSIPVVDDRQDIARLTGAHRFVPDCDSADAFLVLARYGSDLALLWLDKGADGVSVQPQRQADGSCVGHLHFADTPVAPAALIARGAFVEASVSLARGRLLLASAAELLGTAETALALALDHVRLREQFGRKIGSFQALQHRLVDAHVGLELLTSLIFRAATDLDRGMLHPATLHACKAKAGTAALEAIRTALQVHGAIGYTAAHDLNRLFRRAQTLEARFGNSAMHQSAFSKLTWAQAS